MDGILVQERTSPGVAVLRLNRPEVLNALNLDLRRELAKAFNAMDADPEVKVVVLAGAGRAFCAGADLNEYVDASATEVMNRRMDKLWGAIAACSKPVIAAVRGYALGGGCELAMHADIIVAGEGARFGQPEVLLGLMPGGGATQRLTRVLGKFQTMHLLMTGQPIDAAQALTMGLASEVVPDGEVEARTLAMATQFAAGPAVALRLIKEAVLAATSTPLDQGLQLERRSFQMLFSTGDKTEGIRARLERRTPQFGSNSG